MRRFFCVTCQRVKRVRRLPCIDIENGVAVGHCTWHSYSGGKSHAAFMGRDGISLNPRPKPNPKPSHTPSFKPKRTGKSKPTPAFG